MALASGISPIALIETSERHPLVFDRILHRLDKEAQKAKYDEHMRRLKAKR